MEESKPHPDRIIIPRTLLEALWREDVEKNAEVEADADGVTIRMSHMDWESYRHVLRSVKRWLNANGTLICDSCGRLHPDDSDADMESCEEPGCGRFCQRMDNAVVAIGAEPRR
jgi:hypothetical protein